MKRIPTDIIINHIIPYTYNIQPSLLLEDIKNYHQIKKILTKNYKQNLIIKELLSILYIKQKAKKLFSRLFQINEKEYNYKTIYKYARTTQFNILFGLFTKEERIRFLEYIVTNFSKK